MDSQCCRSDSSRRVVNISPGARGGIERQPGGTRGYRMVPGLFIYENKKKQSRGAVPFAGRDPYTTLRGFNGLFTV